MSQRDWTPETHFQFPNYFRNIVRTMLILSLKDHDGNPLFPEYPLYKLPREILFQILRFASWGVLVEFPSDIDDYLRQIPFGHWEFAVADLRRLVETEKKISKRFLAILPQYWRDHFEQNLFRVSHEKILANS